MKTTRRQFIKMSSAALASLTLPSVALASQKIKEANTGAALIPHGTLDLISIENWLNQLSISRKVLLYDNLVQADGAAPIYELNQPDRRYHHRKHPLLACAVNGKQLSYYALPYIRTPINTISTPAKIDHKPLNQSNEFYLAYLLAREENKRLVWLCKHAAKQKRFKCPLSTNVIQNVFVMIQQYDCLVKHVVACPSTAQTIINFGTELFKPLQDRLEHKHTWNLIKGQFENVDVMQTPFLKPNQFIVFSEPNTVGVLVQQKAPYLHQNKICVKAGHALFYPSLCIFGETT